MLENQRHNKPEIVDIRHGEVTVLRISAPPVNAMGGAVRRALFDAIAAAATDPLCAAIVIEGAGPHFSAGADLAELGKNPATPSLSDLCRAVEDSAKPVVVALHGSVMGAGAELAIAAHARVADAAARLGFPDISFGLIPNAGATQRLPRLVGAEMALHLLLTAKPASAVEALTIGLVDQVVESGLAEAAQTLARQLLLTGFRRSKDRTDGMRNARSFAEAVKAARGRAGGQAARALVDCVEAGQLLPFAQGLVFEEAAYADLVNSAESKALRHVILAERRALFPSTTANLPAQGPALGTLALWGGGDSAVRVAVQALAAGMALQIYEPKREVLAHTLRNLTEMQTQAVAAGRLTEAQREADWARFVVASSGSQALEGADLVLRAAGGPLLPATDIPVVDLGVVPGQDPATAVALYPAAARGLLSEIVVGPSANPTAKAFGFALGRRLGWKSLATGAGGPIERRLREALSAAVVHLEAQGHQRAEISTALASFGIGVSPYVQRPALPKDGAPILHVVLHAMMNAGAQMLSGAVATHPYQVDAVAVLSGLFPRWEGGPMHMADQHGALVLRAALRRLSEEAPALFTPAPLFDSMIGAGISFGDLNRS